MRSDELRIGIHPTGSDSFTARWETALQARGAKVVRLDLLGPDSLRQVAGCAGVMWHWPHYPHEQRFAALPMLRVIEEHLHIPIFPDMATCWHFDDKIAQSYLLEALDIPHPKTWVFWREVDALAWCERADYPVVAKLSSGAGGLNVRLIHNVAEAQAYVGQCFSGSGILVPTALPTGGAARFRTRLKRTVQRAAQALSYVGFDHFPPLPNQIFWMPQKNYVLFQEFISGNEFDTRVTVIGNRAFAFRRMNRPGDFRASGSGHIQHESGSIDLRCVTTAFSAVQKLKSQSMAFDFLFRGATKEPVVGEISYGYANWAVERCLGHWDSNLNWHEGRLWPEEAQVEDFLTRIRQARVSSKS